MIATFAGSERWALENILRAGYPAYLPERDVLRRDPVIASKIGIVAEVLWPGYVLVKFTRQTTEWVPLLSLPGVRAILGVNGRPSPVRGSVVDDLIACEAERRIDRAAIAKAPPLAIGSTLEIVAGPLEGWRGVCTGSDDKFAKIRLELLGGMREIDVSRGLVAAR